MPRLIRIAARTLLIAGLVACSPAPTPPLLLPAPDSGSCSTCGSDGGFGSPCSENLNCSSDICLPLASGKDVCTSSCGGDAGDCLSGWTCGTYAGVQGSICLCTPAAETCNGKDDNCDGVVDEEPGADEWCAQYVGSGYTCVNGACSHSTTDGGEGASDSGPPGDAGVMEIDGGTACSPTIPCQEGVCVGSATTATCVAGTNCTSTAGCETADPGTVCRGGQCSNCAMDSDCAAYGSGSTCESGLCSESSCDLTTCNSMCAAESPSLVCDTSTCGCMQGSSCTDADCGGEACTAPATCDTSSCTCTGGSSCTNSTCTTTADCCTGWSCINIIIESYCGQNCASSADCPSGDPCCTDTTGDQVCQVGLGSTCLGSMGMTGMCGMTGTNDATCTTTSDCINAGCSSLDICVNGECNEQALLSTTGASCTWTQCLAGQCVGALSNTACTCGSATIGMSPPIPCE